MPVICTKFILQLKRGHGFCMSRYALLAPFHRFVDDAMRFSRTPIMSLIETGLYLLPDHCKIKPKEVHD